MVFDRMRERLESDDEPPFDPDIVQTIVLQGMRDASVCHHAFSINADGVEDTLELLRQLHDHVLTFGHYPALADGSPDPNAPTTRYALGLTADALHRLGLSTAEFETFPFDFRQGPVDRADFLGDVERNAPDHWVEPFRSDTPRKLHLIISVWAKPQTVKENPQHWHVLPDWLNTDGLFALEQPRLMCGPVGGAEPDPNSYANVGHFGFVDGVMQPRIEGLQKNRKGDGRPIVPPGEFILGLPSELGDHVLRWRVPGNDQLRHRRVGWHGSFAALRVMQQDVDAWHRMLWSARSDHADDLELPLESDAEALKAIAAGDLTPSQQQLAALIVGRKLPGDTTSTGVLDPTGNLDETFVYDPDGATTCPVGSHARRSNPRAGWTASVGGQRRHMIRRGVPYDVTVKDLEKVVDDEAITSGEVGLTGLFIVANLSSQYESVLSDWTMTGVQHPGIVGTNDPLIGPQPVGGGEFHWYEGDQWRSRMVEQVVFTKGHAYLFMPSRDGLDALITKLHDRQKEQWWRRAVRRNLRLQDGPKPAPRRQAPKPDRPRPRRKPRAK